MSNKKLKWANTIAFSVMIIINILANIIPFGAGSTGAVSEKYGSLFTPAPITFTIWGVIYVLMLGFILYEWGVFKPVVNNRIAKSIGPWFVISCMFNTLWIFMWHYELIELSLVSIAGLLVSLIIINKRITGLSKSLAEKAFVKTGFEVYFGWICAALLANTAVFFKYIKWNGFGLTELFWTSMGLLLATIIASAISLMWHKTFPGLAIIWALFGIVVKHSSPTGFNCRYDTIIVLTIMGIVVILSSFMIESAEFDPEEIPKTYEG